VDVVLDARSHELARLIEWLRGDVVYALPAGDYTHLLSCLHNRNLFMFAAYELYRSAVEKADVCVCVWVCVCVAYALFDFFI